jgi:hypothetical protein
VPSREPGVHLTAKGRDAVLAFRRAGAQDTDDHGLYDFVAIATCKCGATFESASGEAAAGALSLLYDHVDRVDKGAGE